MRVTFPGLPHFSDVGLMNLVMVLTGGGKFVLL
jgi:hypothetical protein